MLRNVTDPIKLGPKTKDMLRELADIVENDPAWPEQYMTTVYFKRRGVLQPESLPVVDLQLHVGNEQIPPKLWLCLTAWEASMKFSPDQKGAKTWLIQKLLGLATR